MTASNNKGSESDQGGLYLAAYQQFLTTQPLSVHTRRAYFSRTRLFCTFLQSRPVSYGNPLTAEFARDYAVRDFKSYLKTSHAARPASVNLSLAALDHFYHFIGLAKPLVSREELIQAAPQALSLDEQKHLLRILQTTASARDRAIATLLLYTGLRIGECLALNLEDVIIAERKGRVIVRSGKGNSYREVPLNSQTRQVLTDWKDYRTSHFIGKDNGVAAFFLSRQGQRLTPRATDLRLRQLAAKAGLTFSAHTLRHTCLTNLVRGGHDLVLVAEIAGHKRLETTRRYTLPTLENRESAMQSLEVDY
jgi:site-specific recombinase XerD